MSTHEIENVPAYEALSYTWGQKVIHRVGLDDVRHDDEPQDEHHASIHESLWLALQRLRHETNERVLWIDAICISQTNNDERNNQVLLMRDLFHKAESVVIWLGEESVDSSAAFELIRLLLTAATDETVSGLVDDGAVIKAQELEALGLPKYSSPLWQALNSLFWRPWFSRVWVIQEATVAKDAVVICGPDRCKWSDLIASARYIINHSLTAITRVDPQRVTKFADLGDKFREGPGHLLLELLSQARDSYSTDDRDKVFALLGIAVDAEYGLLKPNYKKPSVDVYTSLTTHFIQRDHRLDILSAVEDDQFRLKRNRSLDQQIAGLEENQLPLDCQLPSWVPDWEVHRPSSPFMLHPAFTVMRASGSTHAMSTFSADGLTLNTSGILVDQVAHVGDSFLETVPAPGSLFPESNLNHVPLKVRLGQDAIDFLTAQRGRQWERLARNLKSYPTGEDVVDVFIKTLVANDDSFKSLPTEDRKAHYRAWRKYWNVAGVIDPNFVRSAYDRNTAEEVLVAVKSSDGFADLHQN